MTDDSNTCDQVHIDSATRNDQAFGSETEQKALLRGIGQGFNSLVRKSVLADAAVYCLSSTCSSFTSSRPVVCDRLSAHDRKLLFAHLTEAALIIDARRKFLLLRATVCGTTAWQFRAPHQYCRHMLSTAVPATGRPLSAHGCCPGPRVTSLCTRSLTKYSAGVPAAQEGSL